MYTFIKLIVIFACHLLIVRMSRGEKARFDNYRVYSVKIANEKQLELLQNLEDAPDGIAYIEAPVSMRQKAEMIVPPHKFAGVNEFFEKFGIESEIKIENIQRWAEL